MSGFCALASAAAAGGLRDELEKLAPSLARRGPDGTRIWADEQVGLVHALMATRTDDTETHQPANCDGVWIVGDMRIDARAELVRSLASAGQRVDDDASDEMLVLRSYLAWGERCVEKLLGDFSFAVWDSRSRELFCARDPLGVKPLFYSTAGERLLASNAIECVLAHPAVSHQLNELAIADFLMFDGNQDPSTTYFSAVQRVPPGHHLRWRAGSPPRLKAYWTAPAERTIRYRDSREYLEHFDSIFESAVADRIRSLKHVALQFSGGMDSTSIAAMAMRVGRAQGMEFRAHSMVHSSLIPDDERRFAQSAADHLGLQVDFIDGDPYRLFEPRPAVPAPPEPFHSPEHAFLLDAAAAAAGFSRVVLTGWDGDMLMADSPRHYFRHLKAQGNYAQLFSALVGYAWLNKRLVPESWVNRATGRVPVRAQVEFPEWIEPAFAQRLRLRERWDEVNAAASRAHPLRPVLFRTLDRIRQHSWFFASFDPTLTGQALDYRHPFLDLRMIEFCLGAPPWPWCDRKYILRTAMRSTLPQDVITRPKTPLNGYPYVERARLGLCAFPPIGMADARIYSYVSRAALGAGWVRHLDPLATWAELRVLSLDQWLKTSRAVPGRRGDDGKTE